MLADFIQTNMFASQPKMQPWEITQNAPDIIIEFIKTLGSDYVVSNNIAVHKTAIVEQGATLKGPVVISAHAFVSSSALLRGGVWLGEDVIIGPACEIKTSFFFKGSKAAHLSFVGDSVIGNNVNIEAGAMLANYRNEKEDKQVYCLIDGKPKATGVEKFGSLVGDNCKIGANAVLAPGTILKPATIVGRLQLIDQEIR